jgi:Ca2+-transporting ATPase
MNYAFLSSLVLILAVMYVPFLQDVFDTQPLGWAQWLEILPLLILPSLAAEINKYITSAIRLRKRQQVSEAVSR